MNSRAYFPLNSMIPIVPVALRRCTVVPCIDPHAIVLIAAALSEPPAAGVKRLSARTNGRRPEQRDEGITLRAVLRSP